MNILFIWLGLRGPLYEWRIRCIRRAIEVYPLAHFQVITTLPEFFGFEIIDAGIYLQTLKVYGIYDLSDHLQYSDYARLRWLSDNPNTLYMDTDTWAIKHIPITDKMGFAKFEAIWNGGDLEEILRVLAMAQGERLLYHLANKFDGHNLKEYCEHRPRWARKYIKSNIPEFDPRLDIEK